MKYVVLITLLALWTRQQLTPEVRLVAGRVRGLIAPDGNHKAYLGVPYARTDRRSRFKEASSVPEWDHVLDAVDEHIRCPQRFTATRVLGQEDCLTLNVYTPLHSDHLLPVMVYFHGGGFREGSNSPFLYGPNYFVDKGVILVTANYRLEILGFLCLGIKEAPGNMGLKDQVLALEWVRDNISFFGGNKHNVTIFGESAGASSVSYHLLSPMSKGLFNQVIIQSGTAITPWSFTYDPLKTASDLAKYMGITTKDPYELHTLFMNKTAEELLSTRVVRDVGNIVLSETLFVPCVEKEIEGIRPFLTDYPHKLFLEGKFAKVPTIIGYNSAEGYMFAGKENDTTIRQIDINKSLPRDLEFPSIDIRKTIAKKVKDYYLGKENVSKENMAQLSRFYGDPFFKYPVIATTDLLLKHSDAPVYSYKFSRDGFMNIAKFFFGYLGHSGATHADDLFYMFKPQFPSFWFLEKTTIDRMTLMWTNFAKYGNPTPMKTQQLPVEWLPTARNDSQVFVIDEDFSTVPLWDHETTKFWHQVYTKYRRKL